MRWEQTCRTAKNWRDSTVALLRPQLPPIPEHGPDTTRLPAKLLDPDEVHITETAPEDLVYWLAKGKLTSFEVTHAFLRRAGLAQRLTNCIVELLPPEALSRAKQLDDYLAQHGKPIGSLHGLPISVKEHIGLNGCRLSAGFVSWWDNRADKDAHVVQILVDAGAIPFVRTTEPQTLMHLETSSNLWGVTVNPYNRNLTSGGSSGGEGALLGLRGSCLGVGSDIGGSIRSPAANCGVYGFRPTSYRVPVQGWAATMLSQEQIVAVIGPLSTSLEGIKLFMRVVIAAQPWLTEPSCIPIPWRESYTHLGNPRKLKIAILWDDGVVEPHPPISRAMQMLVGKLEEFDDIELVHFPPLEHNRAWEIIANLYFCDNANEERKAIDSSKEPWLPLSEFIIKENPYVSHKSIETVWYWTAEREKYREMYAKAWNEHPSNNGADNGKGGKYKETLDAILCPAGPGCAPPLGHSKYWGYTSQWNLLDYPALVFPVCKQSPKLDKARNAPRFGNEKDEYNFRLYDPERYRGMPISLQLVGRRYEDEKVIEALEFIKSKIELPFDAPASRSPWSRSARSRDASVGAKIGPKGECLIKIIPSIEEEHVPIGADENPSHQGSTSVEDENDNNAEKEEVLVPRNSAASAEGESAV